MARLPPAAPRSLALLPSSFCGRRQRRAHRRPRLRSRGPALAAAAILGGLPPALGTGAAPWAGHAPRGPEGQRRLRELFESVATGPELLPWELAKVLNQQRRADGISFPFPEDFVYSVWHGWRVGADGGAIELTADVFADRYVTYMQHRDYMWRVWFLEAYHLPGPACDAKEVKEMCCTRLFGEGGLLDCFNETFSFERCCGDLADAPRNFEAAEAAAAEAAAAAWEAVGAAAAGGVSTQSTVLGPGDLAAVAPVEPRGRSAFFGCRALSCTCDGGLGAPTSQTRVAVLQVGLRARYYPVSTLRHVVGAAVRDGRVVDYSVMLNWHSLGSAWSRRFVQATAISNPAWRNVTKVAMQDHVVRLARRYGARRVQVHLMDPTVPLDPIPPTLTRYFGREHNRHPAFLHYLLKLKKVELLWNSTLERLGPDEDYSQVVLVRDDVHWLDNLRLAEFPDPGRVYSARFGYLCSRPLHDHHPSEHVFVLGGDAAKKLLRVHSEYFQNPSPQLDRVTCTEQYWYVLASLLGVPWELVVRNRLPYLLSMHKLVGADTVFCIRGTTKATLRRPTGSCVHPALVRHPTCDDLAG